VIDRRYIDTLKALHLDVASKMEVGQEVTNSKIYVDNSIQLILSLGLSLIYFTWTKLYPKTRAEAAKWLLARQEFALYEEMWVTVQEIAMHLKDARAARSIRYKSEVCGWIAQKEKYGVDTIRDEVDQWDVSGLDIEYVVYKALLLGELEEATSLIKTNMGRSPFTKYALAVHPIFRELRASGLIPAPEP
jgi:hypothetical protein